MEGEIEAKERAEIGYGGGNLMGGKEDASVLRGLILQYSSTAIISIAVADDWEWEWKGGQCRQRPRSETRGRSDYPIWPTRAGIGE